MNNRLPPGSDEPSDSDKIPADVRAFFRQAARAAAAQDKFGAAAPAAVRRLVRAAYGHDNSQAQTVSAWLASIYNGDCAPPVRLPDLRGLDWSLQVDLVTLMLGTGHAGFRDEAIREAFKEIGGAGGIEWLHWHTAGGPHRQALKHLVTFIKEHRASAAVPGSDAGMLVSCLRSIVNRTGAADLGQLAYLDRKLMEALLLVLDGLWGSNKTILEVGDLEAAFAAEELADFLRAPQPAKV